MNVERALQHYGDFRAGRAVPWLLRPYLELLDEGDHIESYLIGALARRAEYKAVKAFVSGAPFSDLVPGKNGVDQGEVRKWIESLDDEMMDRFLMPVRFCPFCDAARGGGGKANSPYPLSSKSCPHRKLELREGEEEI